MIGERVYLLCRAGTSADDLWSARELLAAACWAADVRVHRHPLFAHLVVLDVIRYEPPGPEGPQPSQEALPGQDWYSG